MSYRRTAAPEHEPVSTVLTHLKEGEITDAIAYFAENIQFRDWGVGVEFKNPRRLGRVFPKGSRALSRFLGADGQDYRLRRTGDR